MPWAPRSPCSHSGCPHRKPCPVHVERPWVRRSSAAHLRTRGTPATRDRAIVLAREPICYRCGQAPSVIADHEIALSEGGLDVLENKRGICDACHRVKTAEESARAKARRRR